MDLGLHDKVAIVTGSSRGLGLASARALVAEGCHVCISARGERRWPRPRWRWPRRRPPAPKCWPWLPTWPPRPASPGRRRHDRALRRGRRAGEQRRPGARRRPAGDDRRRLAGSVRPDAVPGDPRVAPGGAVDAGPRRRRDHDHLVDLRPRSRRPHDLQRGQGGRDQPGQVAGAAAGPRQHPREQRVARIDPVPRRVVGQAPAGRPRGHRRLHQGASCRSAASAAPRKSATSSPSWPRPAPAGSAARRSSSTAARAGRSRVAER